MTSLRTPDVSPPSALVPALAPTPLSAREARAERARVFAFVSREQQAGRLPLAPTAQGAAYAAHSAPYERPPAPGRKRFHVRDLRRLPVAVSRDAQRALIASSSQGRIFAQALSEILGQHPALARVVLTLSDDRTKLLVTAEPTDAEHGLPLLSAVTLAELSALDPQTHHVLFDAVATCRASLRVYDDALRARALFDAHSDETRSDGEES